MTGEQKLRIFIDARMLRQGGTYTYTASLLEALLEIDAQENSYIVLYAPGQPQIQCSDATSIVIPSRNPYYWLLWEKINLPRLLKKYRIDIIHCLRRPVRIANDIKLILTLHSAYPYLHPELQSLSEKLFWNRILRKAASQADGILAVSETDRRNLIKSLALDENKIFTHLLAPPKSISRVDNRLSIQYILSKYRISEPYFLFVGTYYLFKNIPTIIRAFAALKHETSLPHKLVLTGQPGSGSLEVQRAINNTSMEGQIIETDHITDYHELSCLYSGAEAFLFPTTYDSFGFPVLEAMSCGAPVIASTAGALPEVVGDGGLLCDPDNIAGLSKSMIDMASNKNLRQEIIRKGYRRVESYSWERCARQTLATYQTIMSLS